MMLIQYVLVLFSIALLVLFLRKRGTTKSAAGVKLAFLLFVAFGIYAVLRPGDVTVVAGWLGVGRGTDLLLYALVVVFTFATLNVYLRFKELELRYARLARSIALRNAEPPHHAEPHRHPVPSTPEQP
ncbi:DUF2304 domain-containing protein [Saccharothrix syringae]|uniref:DUF2304 domain-containing protein n=1 Tax=Saccharothrix syringae TaxID=103733 RepID=A0A5Q0HCW0_SACSY|nr:DUF2304 domain-containing protein [Saccharothrix syringae]